MMKTTIYSFFNVPICVETISILGYISCNFGKNKKIQYKNHFIDAIGKLIRRGLAYCCQVDREIIEKILETNVRNNNENNPN